MFGNIGWAELVIIVIAGLVILGPERLPGAMSWLARSIKQVRAYATGAQTQLRDELGPEFEDLRKPLSELQQLRGMTPRAAITKHLLDGDDSIFTGEFDTPAANGAGTAAAGRGPAHGAGSGGAGADGNGGRPEGRNPSPGRAEGDGAQEARPTSPRGPVAYDDDAT